MTGSEEHLLSRYRRLMELIRDIASTLDLDLLLNRVTTAAVALTECEAASILLYDAQREVLKFQEASNFDRPFIRGLVVPIEGSIAGWVLQNREPAIVDHPQNDPRFFAEIQHQTHVPTHSLLAVPLTRQDRMIGVLEAINKTGSSFTQEDQDMLIALATQAAIAIENARLFARSDLITEIVHELRTPLTSINAAANLLSRPDINSEQRSSIIDLIQKETRRLTELTSHFLDLARLESGQMEFQMEEIPISELLEECVQGIRGSMAEKRISLHLDLPDDLPALVGDRTRLQQVFTNLLSNAVKFNQPGGKVKVWAEAREGDLVITFEDTGRGIPPENIEHLFEKFYRAPGTEHTTHGTGLGLYIVNRIIKAHGGKIDTESTPGEGSRFIVRLPEHSG